MNALIYLGDVPPQGVTPIESLQARNIHFTRIEPSKLVPVIHHEFSSTTYEIYKNNLPTFIQAAIDGKATPLIDPYHQLSHEGFLSVAASDVPVIISFASKIREEAREQLMRDYGLEDTLVKGKPALMGKINYEQVREIVRDHSPSYTTPTTSTHINISTFMIYRLLHRLAHAFLKTHQYPTRVNDDNLGQWERKIEVSALEQIEHMEVDIDHPAWVQRFLSLNSKYVAHSNLAESFQDYNPEIENHDEIPADAQGFCFPFVPELSLPDFKIVPAVVSTFFLGALGDTSEEADEVFENLKGGWGSLCRTPLGFELAHLYWCISLAIQSQSQLLVVKTTDAEYAGCILVGGGFQMNIRGRLLEPCSREDLVSAFDLLSPHTSTLRAIYNRIAFPSLADRQRAMNSCNSIHALRNDLASKPVAEDKRDEIRELAFRLRFDGNSPMTPTAYNVSVVLNAISDPDIDEAKFPLYPSFVIEKNRTKRLLSAFGATAPSFIVPGGKSMMLSSSMEVKEKTRKGGEQTRQVTKVGYILKPVDQAAKDLESVMNTKSICNPHGSAMMGRGSSSSLIRSAEKDIASNILASLRKISAVTVADPGAGSKRKREDDGEGKGKKRKGLLDV